MADTSIVRNTAEYMYCQTNLLLAGCDDPRVHAVLDYPTVNMMCTPVSFDVQHPNKVKGHFTLGYLVYSHELRKILTLALVMIPALDEHNGYHAKSGDNTAGASHIMRADSDAHCQYVFLAAITATM